MLFVAYMMRLVSLHTVIDHHCVSGLYIQVFHSLFWPLEFTVPSRDNNKCYAKILCNKLDNVRLLLLLHSCISSEPVATSSLHPLVV